MTPQEEQMQELEQIANSLADSKIHPPLDTPKTGRESGSATGRKRAAGRTIGLSAPQHPASFVRNSPSSGTVTSAIQKLIPMVDSRIVTLLSQIIPTEAPDDNRVELALLTHARRGLMSHLDAVPSDVVLCESLFEYVGSITSILDDLGSGGSARLMRLIDFNRVLASELAALGGTNTPMKNAVKKTRALLSQNEKQHIDAVAKETLLTFIQLQHALELSCPKKRHSLLDQVVRLG